MKKLCSSFLLLSFLGLGLGLASCENSPCRANCGSHEYSSTKSGPKKGCSPYRQDNVQQKPNRYKGCN